MEKTLDYRSWDELLPEMLGLIFKRLELDDKLDVVPRVCKAWAEAIKIPDCWQEIDIQELSLFYPDDDLDRILTFLIGRSSGMLQKLSVCFVKTKLGLSLIRDNANNLRILELPLSEISNSMVEQIAEKLSNLTCLDLSQCLNIGAPAIEAIGKHCKLLTHLKRNMYTSGVLLEKREDAEALAIAATMPQLKHLEISYMNVTTKGVVRILTNCLELEFLDVRGCGNVKLDDAVLKKRFKLTVMGPDIPADTETDDDVVCCWNSELANLCDSVHSVNVDMVTYPDDNDDG